MEYRTIRMAPPPAEGGATSPLAEGVVLSSEEARVLGCLVEKELSTPDYYPLTLNALVAACNQKSSRNPVVEYAEDEVQAALDGLKEKRLANRITSSDARVPRYRHLFYDAFRLTQQQGAALCVLLLRGAQTVGEIRQRSQRLYPFETLAEVEETIEELESKSPAPLVVRLGRRPGEKESRYAHLLSGEPDEADLQEEGGAAPRSAGASASRIESLEAEVAELRERLSALETEFERFRSQF